MIRLLVLFALGAAGCGTLEGVPSADDGGAAGEAGADAGADPYRQSVVNAGPLAYWRLDDADGDPAKDEIGFANGTYSGGCTHGVPGAQSGGRAVRFDGSSCRIDLGKEIPFLANAAYTIEAWASYDGDKDGYRHIFTNESRTNGAPTTGYALLMTHPTAALAERWPGGTRAEYMQLPTGFVHLVAVYDGSALTLYVNGAVAQQTATSTMVTDPMSNAFIGATVDHGAYGNYFGGVLDEIAVYDRVLSEDVIRSHYAQRRP
ncbi:MAG TPA: LamG domain-containing protein [Labilithrix sp.]|jgi:hypothetical protein